MGYVKRKATTKANPNVTEEKFLELKKSYLDQIVSVVAMAEIPHNLIINLDQTGMKLVPAGDWTMAPLVSKRVEIAGLGDKRQITATFAGSLDGNFLPMQVLYQGKTTRCHPHFTFLKNLIFFTRPITGPMRRQLYATLAKSFFPM